MLTLQRLKPFVYAGNSGSLMAMIDPESQHDGGQLKETTTVAPCFLD
jgi:hypothetical protein